MQHCTPICLNLTSHHEKSLFVTKPPHRNNLFYCRNLRHLIINAYTNNAQLFNIRLRFLGQFTEDGSFIGQYVPGKPQQPVSPQPTPHNSTQQPGASSVATYV